MHGGYGIDAGQKIGDAGHTDTNAVALASSLGSQNKNQDRTGWLGGGQVGHDLQLGNTVFGAEGDFSNSHERGTSNWYGADTRRTEMKSDLA